MCMHVVNRPTILCRFIDPERSRLEARRPAAAPDAAPEAELTKPGGRREPGAFQAS